jgi:hypothetical protein
MLTGAGRDGVSVTLMAEADPDTISVIKAVKRQTCSLLKMILRVGNL